jgi:tRNA(Ile)-lysidine synthase
METLLSTVLDTIREYGMFLHGDSVVVAVSGGPDSVCLLHLLNELRGEFSLQLRVAHLDHSTRDGESTEDALFVESLAERMGLECHVETVDVARTKPPDVSFEAAARDFRYEFLTRVAKQTGFNKIALGHTANDQAETMLMRLISGTGRRGFAGIRPVRALDDVILVRPLIDVKRNEILSYLRSNSVPYRVDKTNLDPAYFRNKVRLELIPLLEKGYNPQVLDALLRSVAVLQGEEEYLSGCARELAARVVMRQNGSVIEMSRDAYASASPVLRRRLIMDIARRLSGKKPRLTGAAIEAADALCVSGRTGSRMFISDDVEISVERDRILAKKVLPHPTEASPGRTFSVPLPGRVSLEMFGIELETSLFDRSQSVEELIADCGPQIQFFDVEKLSGDLYVRTRLPGDWFYPLGLGGKKKLSDYFIDTKRPRDEREETALLLSGEDIIWVIGGAVDDRFKLTDATRKVLKVQCEQVDQTV